MIKEKYSIHSFGKKLLQKSVFPHLESYIKWRKGEKDMKSKEFAPVSINLDLITACNHRCAHCIDGELLNNGLRLDLEYTKTLIESWKESGLRSVILIGGGEPTLSPHFEEITEFLKSLSLQVGIVSNGLCIDKIMNICKIFKEKDWVRFSLDAGSNGTFQKIHNPRINIQLETIMQKAKELKKINNSLQTGFSFLIIGKNKYVNNHRLINNIHEISLSAKIAKENDFSYLSLKPFICPEKERITEISEEDLKEIEQQVIEAKKFEDSNFKVIESINLSALFDKELYSVLTSQPKICHAQFFRSVVTPSGIFQCSLWRGFDDIKAIGVNQKVDEIYHEKFHQARRRLVDDFDASKICNKSLCLYGSFNHLIDELIANPEKSKELAPIEDFNDYFL